MKRKLVLAALILAAVFGTAIGFGQDSGLKPAPDMLTASNTTTIQDHVTLTWTGNPATTMTITWRTEAGATSGAVVYTRGSSFSARAPQVQATATDFDTDKGPCRLFTANLSGLSPNTTYSYRVGNGDRWSESHSFTTAAPKPRAFRFLVFGDSQSSTSGDAPYGKWRTTVHNAYEANPSAKFMVNVGDMVNTGQSMEHWNCWFAATTGVIDSIPEMPVLGNHEYAGGGGPSYTTRQFPVPQNGPEGLKSRVYSYDYGRVHFVVLDSERVKGDILDPLQKWLDDDVSASKATWKIVFIHKSPYEIKDDRSNEAIRAALCPTLEKNHADLVLCGHDHGIARTWPMKNGARMSKPSQGTIYFTTGRSGDKTYKDLSKRAWNSFLYNPLAQPNYLVVEVNDMKLTVRTVNQDGTPIDTFVIDKKSDTTSDGAPSDQKSE